MFISFYSIYNIALSTLCISCVEKNVCVCKELSILAPGTKLMGYIKCGLQHCMLDIVACGRVSADFSKHTFLEEAIYFKPNSCFWWPEPFG